MSAEFPDFVMCQVIMLKGDPRALLSDRLFLPRAILFVPNQNHDACQQHRLGKLLNPFAGAHSPSVLRPAKR